MSRSRKYAIDEVLILPLGPQTVDLTGQEFERLLVIGYAGKRKRLTAWWCRCTCGSIVKVLGSRLKNSNTSSCGCLHSEQQSRRMKQQTPANKKHGLHKSPEYQCWRGMRERCENPNCRAFRNYGARGISVAVRWCGPDGFVNFYADMGPRPSEYHSLDRVNNDGNYEPSNCRWATKSQQLNNRRGNHLLTHNGRTQTIMEWSRETGLTFACIKGRLKLGWDAARVLTTPVTHPRGITSQASS